MAERENKDKIFAAYLIDLNPEHWRDFSEFMWDLGFEMDCYRSAPFEFYRQNEETEKQAQDRLLESMKSWSTQLVGNYVFSRYRDLTHWCDYGYPEEQGPYFFQKAFPILQEKLLCDWEERNTIPLLSEFIELVREYIAKNSMGKELQEFAQTEEGLYHIEHQYKRYVRMCEEKSISVPMLRGKVIQEVAYYLEELY